VSGLFALRDTWLGLREVAIIMPLRLITGRQRPNYWRIAELERECGIATLGVAPSSRERGVLLAQGEHVIPAGDMFRRMASASVLAAISAGEAKLRAKEMENLLTGRWGPDQQILTWWRRELGYDVDKVMVIGGRPELRLHPWT
jgi:hypothetical protein